MDLDLVRQLIETVSRSPIGELQIEKDGLRIRICKRPSSAQAGELSWPAAGAEPAASSSSAPGASTAILHSIRAPLTGVFYRSAGEGEPPLVSVGDVVEEGQKIGVLEAMKTFNIVESDRAGKVVEIAFADQSGVQSGDVLFLLEDVG